MPTKVTARARFNVAPDGSTRDIAILSSSDPDWTNSVTQAIRKWKAPCGGCPEGCPATALPVEQDFDFELI